MTTNIENMLKLIGGGTSGWQTRAAEVMDISRGTVRNALKGDVSEKSLKKIKATYAAMCRHAVPQDADRTAGAWVIGMPLRKSVDKSIMDECVVTHMQEPSFSVHVILRAGKTTPGPLGERDLDVRTTTISGDKTGFGTLHEKAQQLGLDYMKKAQFDRLEVQYRTDVEARAVAKKWGLAKEARAAKIAELVDAFDVLTDDDVRAAHVMIREMQSEGMSARREMGDISEAEAMAFEAGRTAGEISARAMLLSELLNEIVARRDRAETIPGARVIRRAVADMKPVQHVYRGSSEYFEKVEAVRVSELQEAHGEGHQRLADVRAHARDLLEKAGVEVSEIFVPVGMSWLDADHLEAVHAVEAEALAGKKWTVSDVREAGRRIARAVSNATSA